MERPIAEAVYWWVDGYDVDLKGIGQRQNLQDSSVLTGICDGVQFAVEPVRDIAELVSVVVLAVAGELKDGSSTKLRRRRRVAEDRQRHCMIYAVAVCRGVDGGGC